MANRHTARLRLRNADSPNTKAARNLSSAIYRTVGAFPGPDGLGGCALRRAPFASAHYVRAHPGAESRPPRTGPVQAESTYGVRFRTPPGASADRRTLRARLVASQGTCHDVNRKRQPVREIGATSARWAANRCAASSAGGLSINRPSRASRRPRTLARPWSLRHPASRRSRS